MAYTETVSMTLPYLAVTPTLLTSGLLLIIFYIFFIYFYPEREPRVYPPGPPGIPILGNMLSFIFTRKEEHEVLFDLTNKYGPICSLKILDTRVIVVSDIGLVQEALNNPGISDRGFPNSKELMGREKSGIHSTTGDTWKEQRGFFVKNFAKGLNDKSKLEDVMSSHAKRLLESLDKQADGKSFDPGHSINCFGANVITEIITGNVYAHDNPEFSNMISCSLRGLDLIGPALLLSYSPFLSKLPTPRKKEILRLLKVAVEFTRKAIHGHKDVFDASKPPSDFIGSYLMEIAQRAQQETPGSFDEVNLLATSISAILGAVAICVHSLSRIVAFFAANQDIQERVYLEISTVIGNRYPSYHDRHALPITMAAIAEFMRISPSSALQLPRKAAYDCKIAGYDVPKGSIVVSNAWYLTHSPTLWDHPEEFQLDRFLEPDSFAKLIDKNHFGWGPRICPGEAYTRMKMFLTVTYILQRYKLTVPEGGQRPAAFQNGLFHGCIPFNIQATMRK